MGGSVLLFGVCGQGILSGEGYCNLFCNLEGVLHGNYNNLSNYAHNSLKDATA